MAATRGTKDRGPGTPAGIDKRQIIDAAQRLQPGALTMQAVAAELGVDRSAVNYHVKDRDGLKLLVATDVFAKEFARYPFTDDQDWQALCRTYARAMRDALVATGALISYFRFETGSSSAFLEQTDRLVASLLEAGVPPTRTGQSVIMLTNIAMSLARDLWFSQTGGHPQMPGVQDTFGQSPRERFSHLREVTEVWDGDLGGEAQADLYGDAQFDLSLEIFVRGLEQVAAREGYSDRANEAAIAQ